MPLQYIGTYSHLEISEDQRNMMLLGYARSPGEAQRLLDKSGCKTAAAYLAKYPRKKVSIWQRFKRRLFSLILRIEGGSFTHPLDYRDKPERMVYTVSFEEKENED